MLLRIQYGEAVATPYSSPYWSNDMKDRWLCVDEISQYLGVKRETLYKWISERGIPALKVGRLWKFKKDEVGAWVRGEGVTDCNNKEDAE